MSAPNPQSTTEDTPLVFNAANRNLISVSDLDAGEVLGSDNVKITLSVNSGTLTLSTTSNLDFETDGNIGDGTSDATMTFRGSLADVNAALDGLSYRGNPNFNSATSGADQLTITINDLGNTGQDPSLVDGQPSTGDATSEEATATVAITVTPVNDAPVNTVPVTQLTDNETALFFNAAKNNLITVSDVDVNGAAGPNNTLEVTLAVNDGSLTLSQITGLTFTAGDGTEDATMTFVGTVANINAALDGLQFFSNPAFDGDCESGHHHQ